MKQPETLSRIEDKKYLAVMILCFLYGGFSLFLSAVGAYTIIMFPQEELNTPPQFIISDNNKDSTDINQYLTDRNEMGPNRADRMRFLLPFSFITSPLTIVFVISGIVAFLGGISIWNLTRRKEMKKVREKTMTKFLLPDEKKIIEVLQKDGYESTQTQITKESGMTKVKVHRAIQKLEEKGVVEKYKYGLTNKIILKKDI